MNKGGVFGQIRPKERKMQKWKYHFYYTSIEIDSMTSSTTMIWNKRENQQSPAVDDIQNLGTDGWELISVTPISTAAGRPGQTREILFTFKKPID